MDSRHEKEPHSMRRLRAEALLLGTVVSVTLLLLGAPVWTFYLGGVLTLPLLAYRLPQMDTEPGKRRRRHAKP